MLAGQLAQTAAVAPDVGFDRGPRGFRLCARPGRVTHAARDGLARDLDEMAELAAGIEEIKVQLFGPWSLACELELANGHRAVSDQGAVNELAAQLAAGIEVLVAGLSGRLSIAPARVHVQFDEPWLSRVIAGSVPGTHQFDSIAARSPERCLEALAVPASAAPGPVLLAVGPDSVPGGSMSAIVEVATGLEKCAGTGDESGFSLIVGGVAQAARALDAVGGWLDAGYRLGLEGADAQPAADLLGLLGLVDRAGLIDVVADGRAPSPSAAYRAALYAARALG